MDVDFARLERDILKLYQTKIQKDSEISPEQKEMTTTLYSISINCAMIMLEGYHLMLKNPDEYNNFLDERLNDEESK